MKAVKLSALAVATMISSTAMANVVTDTAGTVVDGTRTIFSTITNPAAVSAEVGTLGYGANIAWAVNDTTEIQAGWAGGDVAGLFKDDISVDGTTYDLDTDFSNPYIGVQMRPAANWFTVGAGVIVPDNDIKVRARQDANDTYTVRGQTYRLNPGEIVEGRLEHRNTLAPYLTVGFRPNLNNHWGVFGEIGATYMGHADATITSSNAAFNEAAKNAIEDKDYATWYPIVKLGATYRF